MSYDRTAHYIKCLKCGDKLKQGTCQCGEITVTWTQNVKIRGGWTNYYEPEAEPKTIKA